MPIQALKWTEFLSCPVCCNDFDWNSRVPVSLGCGHTICNKCLKNLHKKQCPLDQNTINTDINKLPINEALLQLIEKNNTNENNLQVSVSPLSQEFQSQNDYQDYLKSKKCIEELARYLKPRREEGGEVSFVSRPIHRKLVTLISCQLIEPSGRSRAIRTSRSIGERCVTELILYHQNPQQLSSNLWTAVRSRGCQFLGPEMQEQVLKLILLALEDGSALSRKVLVMFVVQRLEPHYPQASKTSIGHVVQLLYRASCFKVLKRENDSALMELKNLYTNYEALRREHDAQIVQIAIDSGLRIAPDQWSALLYGDGNHKSHMQSIIDKLQTSQSFSQSINELFIYLQRSKCSNNNFINDMRENLELLASIDCGKNQGTKVDESVNNNNWPETRAALEAVKEVVEAYVKFFKRDGENRCVHSEFYKAHYYHHHYYHHHHLHHHHYHHHHHLLHRNNQQQNESVVNSNNMFRGSCPHTTNCNFIHSNFEIDHQRKRNQILQVGGIAEDSVGMSDDEGGIDEKKKIQGGDLRQFYHHHHQVCHYGNENNEILSISVKKDKSITKKLQILVQRKAVMIEQLEKLKIDGAS